MTEYLIKDFKGHSIGYNYDESTDTYTWFTIEPPKHGEEPFKVTFGGEWAAQAARTRFLDNIDDMFNRYFKREFARLDIDPATGRHNPCAVIQNPCGVAQDPSAVTMGGNRCTK